MKMVSTMAKNLSAYWRVCSGIWVAACTRATSSPTSAATMTGGADRSNTSHRAWYSSWMVWLSNMAYKGHGQSGKAMNGGEMVVGESIIMPMAVRMLAMTRSMMRKGRKIRNPIWNAADSSLTVKAGTTTTKSRSLIWEARSGLRVFWAVLRKKARSWADEWRIRKSRRGSLAASATASMPEVLPMLETLRARSAMSNPTGSMT